MISLDTLQREIHKNPQAYASDYSTELEHVKTLLDLIYHSPKTVTKENIQSLNFVRSCCRHYVRRTKKTLLHPLLELVEKCNFQSFSPPLIQGLMGVIFKFRDIGVMSDVKRFFGICFSLLRVHNKSLRKYVGSKLLNEIMNNKKNQLHQKISKNTIFGYTKDENKTVCKQAYDLLISLYRKQIWNDDKRVVNILCESCLHTETRICVTGLCFFLNETFSGSMDDLFSRQNDERNIMEQIKTHIITFNKSHSRKTKKRVRKYENSLKKLKKEAKKQQNLALSYEMNESAKRLYRRIFEQISNPGKFAKRVFARLRGSSERFEVKLMMMRVISRVISVNRLQIFSFYPYIQRYLEPSYEHVTKILATVAESIHNLVPENIVLPLVNTIANHFINEKSEPVDISVGLNCIRLICERQPAVMTKDLLNDVATYGRHAAKMVAIAARGIINLYREVNPDLLSKKIKTKLIQDDDADEDDKLVAGNGKRIDDEKEMGDGKIRKVDELKMILGKRKRKYNDGDEKEDDEGSDVDEFVDLEEFGEDEEDEIVNEPPPPKYQTKSLTNRKKSRNKNFFMVKMGKGVRKKNKMSSKERFLRKKKTKKRNVVWRKKKRKKRF